MIGLLKKDFLVLQMATRTYILFLLFYLVLTVVGAFSLPTVVSMIQVILLMIPMSAFAYDEHAKWDRYAMCLPLGRSLVVRSRYLFVLVLLVVAVGINLSAFVIIYVAGAASTQELLEALASLLVSTGVGVTISAILLPLNYKLGPERARPYLLFILLLPTVLFFGAAKLGLLQGVGLSQLSHLTPAMFLRLCALVPLAALLGLIASFFVSFSIVAKKEY